MHLQVTLYYLLFALLSAAVHPISTEEGKAHGGLRLYPLGRVTNDKNGRKITLTVNLRAKKKYMAEKLRKLYTDNLEICSEFNTTEVDSRRKCSPSDNFGENSDYFCFILRLEKTKHWKPRGFTKTTFLPNYNQSFIPVTCFLTAGYLFAPLDKYEKKVQLWPASGFPLSYFSGGKHPKECSPLVTGIIDDPRLFESYFEYRKLQCKVWDFAKLKQDHLTVFLDFKGQPMTPSSNANLSTTTETNTIPLILESKQTNGTDVMAAEQFILSKLESLMENSANEGQQKISEEYLERRDPSVPVQSLYEELDLDVPASK